MDQHQWALGATWHSECTHDQGQKGMEESDKDSVEEEEFKAGHIPLQKELDVRKCIRHTKALTQSYVSCAHPGAYRHARSTTRHGNLRKAESLQTGP